MQLKMYSIRDAKGEIYHPPFFKNTHGEAERDFTQLVRDPKTQPGQFPEDFDLYHLGTYDNQTGKLASLDSPQHMIKAIDVTQR